MVGKLRLASTGVPPMMWYMDLYILRHGEAVELGTVRITTDFGRPLTPAGKRMIGQVARAMCLLDVQVDLVLTSPFVRARQTAEIAARVLKVQDRVVLADELVVGASERKLITRLRQLDPPPKAVLLVGHEPYLSRLVSVLVTGAPDALISLKKGGLCKLTVDKLRFGRCARLEWLLAPAQMQLMRGGKTRTGAGAASV